MVGGGGGCSSAADCTVVAVLPGVAGPADVAGAGSADVAVLQCGFVGSILARKTTGNLWIKTKKQRKVIYNPVAFVLFFTPLFKTLLTLLPNSNNPWVMHNNSEKYHPHPNYSRMFLVMKQIFDMCELTVHLTLVIWLGDNKVKVMTHSWFTAILSLRSLRDRDNTRHSISSDAKFDQNVHTWVCCVRWVCRVIYIIQLYLDMRH